MQRVQPVGVSLAWHLPEDAQRRHSREYGDAHSLPGSEGRKRERERKKP